MSDPHIRMGEVLARARKTFEQMLNREEFYDMRDWRNLLAKDARALLDGADANEVTITVRGQQAILDLIRSLELAAACSASVHIHSRNFHIEGKVIKWTGF